MNDSFDTNGPLRLVSGARVGLVKPGCFDDGVIARVRRWLPYNRSYALRLETASGSIGGVVFATPDQIKPL
jgi:hypothetical protein